MSNRKLNRFEIKSLARTILTEAAETIKANNNAIMESKKYLNELEKIKKANPLNKLREDFLKMAKIELGTKEGSDLDIHVGSYRNIHDKKERDSIAELNGKMLKMPKIDISLESLEDELILAQVSSVSLTTLKALKISELTK